MFSNFNSINLFDIFIIFQNIHYYFKLKVKLVKGHLERAVIEFDKLAAPLFPIKLSLELNYERINKINIEEKEKKSILIFI
jgi:hypothetical protein